MSILRPARNEAAYLKMSFQGQPKSGKSYTAGITAIGLHKWRGLDPIKSPIAMFDTEPGSDYLKHLFDEAGIGFEVVKSRSFADMMEFVKEVEERRLIALIDSITHPWAEIQESFKKRKGRTFIKLNEWGHLKAQWGQFTERYVNGQFDCILCGRLQDVWDTVVDEEGTAEDKRVGTKMATEKGVAYEPSLMIEMNYWEQKIPLPGGGTEKKVTRRAKVLGDRFGVIDGMSFDNPTFECFLPFVERLAKAEHVGFDASRTSEGLFNDAGENRAAEYMRKKTIALEEIQAAILLLYPGQTAAEKTGKAELVYDVFRTRSWTAVENMQLSELELGLGKILSKLEAKQKEEASAIQS